MKNSNKIHENNKLNDKKIDDAVAKINETAENFQNVANEKILEMSRMIENFKEQTAQRPAVSGPVAPIVTQPIVAQPQRHTQVK